MLSLISLRELYSINEVLDQNLIESYMEGADSVFPKSSERLEEDGLEVIRSNDRPVLRLLPRGLRELSACVC